jgi:hypothetical protein
VLDQQDATLRVDHACPHAKRHATGDAPVEMQQRREPGWLGGIREYHHLFIILSNETAQTHSRGGLEMHG